MKPFVLSLLLLLLGLCSAAPAAPIALVDDAGQQARFNAPPQRIITLLPSLTETVCALGACAHLVGVDRYSNYPAEVAKLPKLGGLDDSNVEAIVALRPDVVLLAPSSRITERLRALGLTVLTLEAKTYADVQRVLAKVGLLLGSGEAPAVWRQIQASVAAAAQSLPAEARGVRVYYEVDRAPFAAGTSSFMGETLTLLGARNIIPPELGPFPKINPEFVLRANPELIMIGQRHADGLNQRPGWAGISAIRQQKICTFDAAQSDVLARPGPRMGEAAQLMAACLQRHFKPAAKPAPTP